MPKLHKYIGQDGHYIKGALPGSGQISTLQVTPEALRRIKAEIGQGEGEFSVALLRELLKEKLVYTKGLFPPGNLPSFTVERDQRPVAPRSGAKLIFIESGHTWALAVHVSELPSAWTEASSDLVSDLAGWRITVAGSCSVSAMQFYPGRGGAAIPVAPQREPYAISAEGTWPKAWPVTSWLVPPVGLGGGVALFRGDSGERVRTGYPLELGDAYTLIVPDRLTTGPNRLLPPPQLSPEHLGRVSQWHAWSIEVPERPDEQVRSWFARAGLRLAEARFRLSLITPPRGYSEEGQAIITAGEEVVLALAPLQPQAGLETSFYTARIEQTGPCVLTVEDMATTPLRLLVKPNTDSIRQVMPATLRLNVTWGNTIAFLQGLGAAQQHELLRPVSASAEAPSADVVCPAPVTLIVQLGDCPAQWRELPADEAGPQLADALREAGRRNLPLAIQIEAGAFGRLSLRVPAHAETLTPIPTLSPAALRRARWLAAALPALSRAEAVVLIPTSLRDALDRIAAQPGCHALRDVKFLPLSLLPHLRVLTSLLER